ncbi:hypothetical protein ASC58_12320 [Phycicoccus sp. Root101]|nr:hypothetical protein ASC58_12320 [Phycicoccus sp. Root101]
MFGLGAGSALACLLILLPRAIEGDDYEVTDPLVFMGVPLVVIGASIGALIGTPGAAERLAGQSERVHRPLGIGRALVPSVAGIAAGLAFWLFLWAIGAVDATPLGLW